MLKQIGRAGQAFWATLTDKPFLNLPDSYRDMAACDLDDRSLVQWVRWALANSAKFYEKDAAERGRNTAEIITQHGVVALALLTLKMGATQATFDVEGITYRGDEQGDWRVTIERTNPPHVATPSRTVNLEQVR